MDRRKSISWLREVALSAIDAIWVRQAADVRFVVPNELRSVLRQERQTARGLLDAYRSSRSESARRVLAELALTAHLRLLAHAATRRLGHDSLETGAELVEKLLPSGGICGRFQGVIKPDGRLQLPNGNELPLLLGWIDALVDVRTERERSASRRLPWLIIACAVAVAAIATNRPRNIALGRTVRASSICNDTPAAPPDGQRLARVVDGNEFEVPAVGASAGENGFAVCTEPELHPWVEVDLKREREIREVVVYNRSDCCWSDAGELGLQTSLDGERFVTLATRQEPFTPELPWHVHLDGRRARYVRVTALGNQAVSLALSELEVRGR